MALKKTINKANVESPFSKAKEAIKKDFNSEYLKFSFKYLDSVHDKFVYGVCDSDYFCMFLDRLKEISKMSMIEFKANRSKTLRSHPIDWKDNGVSEMSFGIANEDEIAYDPYQFSLTANEYGRIHGFIIGDRFYLVWLDKEHNLYPGQK